MKRIALLFFMVALYSFAAKAQIDIKLFNKVGPQVILTYIGNTTEKWEDYSSEDGSLCFGYHTRYGFGPSGVSMSISSNGYYLENFSTDSPKYCVLSDLIPGGIKVGDKLSNILAFDFVHTPYGRNKSANALKSTGYVSQEKGEEFLIFDQEYEYITLWVKNDIITMLQFITRNEDDLCDRSISLL